MGGTMDCDAEDCVGMKLFRVQSSEFGVQSYELRANSEL